MADLGLTGLFYRLCVVGEDGIGVFTVSHSHTFVRCKESENGGVASSPEKERKKNVKKVTKYY